MAKLTQSTKIGAQNSIAGYTQQLNIYSVHDTTEAITLNFFHFKTNINNFANKIIAIESIGYNYQFNAPIRCIWCFYTWNGTLYNRGLVNTVANGLTADGLYLSTDNYVVLRARSYGGTWYSSFVLNAYINALYYTEDVQITAAVRNDNSGNHY